MKALLIAGLCLVLFLSFASSALQAATALTPQVVADRVLQALVGSGTSANLIGQGTLAGVMFTLTAGQTDAVNTSGLFMVPTTTPAVGTGFDSTIANILDFFVGFSISNAANTVTVDQYSVESLN